MFKIIKISIILFMSSINCDFCKSGCLKCNKNQQCLMCDVNRNFKLLQFQCIKQQVENCSFQSLSGSCLICSENYFMDTILKKCVKVETNNIISNCTFYNNQQQCETCQNGFFIFNGQCIQVINPIQGCEQYLNQFACLKCSQQYWMSVDGRECNEKPDQPKCLNYSSVICKKCVDNYLKNSNYYIRRYFEGLSQNDLENQLLRIFGRVREALHLHDICEEKAVDNCVEFSTYRECRNCKIGYYLTDDFKCELNPIPQISNCLTYTDNQNCSECKNEYFMKDTQNCQKVNAIEFCKIYDGTSSSRQCTQCLENYFLESQKCNERQNTIENCKTYNNNLDECQICEDSFEITSDNLKCLKQIPFCDEYENTNSSSTEMTCKICLKKYIKSENQCKEGNLPFCEEYDIQSTLLEQICSKCVNGYYLSNQLCKPIDDINNCEIYSPTEASTCQTCKPDHYNFLLQSKCIELTEVSNCKQYDQTGCIDCEDGFDLLQDPNRCEAYGENYLNCLQKTDSLCTKCKDGFILFDNLCQNPLLVHKKNCSFLQLEDKTQFSPSNDTSMKKQLCHNCELYSTPINYKDQVICVEKQFVKENISETTQEICLVFNEDESCAICKASYYLEDGECINECPNGKIPQKYHQESINICVNEDTLNHQGCSVFVQDDSMNTVCGLCQSQYTEVITYTSLLHNQHHFEVLSTSIDVIPDIFKTYYPKKCFLTTSTKVNNEANKQIINCQYYIKTGDSGNFSTLECLGCNSRMNGVVNIEWGGLQNCEYSQIFEQNQYLNMSSPFDSIFSGNNCKNEGEIPFAAYVEDSSSDKFPKRLCTFNITSTTTTGINSTEDQNAIVCYNPFNNKILSDILPLSCGAAVFIMDYTNDKCEYKNLKCVACKPSFLPTYETNTKFISECNQISHCDGYDHFDSCSECKAGYTWSYDTNSHQIEYSKCKPYTVNDNCWAVDDNGVCKLCKKGYQMNEDNVCTSYYLPGCLDSLNLTFQFEYSDIDSHFSLNSPTSSLFIYKLWYKELVWGCRSCLEDYYLLMNRQDEKICTENRYLRQLNDQNSIFINHCNKYSGIHLAPNFQCNQCEWGYIPTQDLTQCKPAQDFCQTLSSTNTSQCIKCEKGYSLINNNCEKGTISNCQIFYHDENKSEMLCKKCDNNYYLSSDSKNCLLSKIKNCKIPATNNEKCIECEENYVKMDYGVGKVDYCFKIDPVLNCRKGTITSVNQQHNIECDECQKINQIKIDRSLSSQNEALFPSKTICMQFTLIENCSSYTKPAFADETSFYCKDCEKSYYFKEENFQCIKRENLSINCLSFDSKSDKCLQCNQSTFLVDNNTKCQNNPDGIQGCDVYKFRFTCEICQPLYFLVDDGCTQVLNPSIVNCLRYLDQNTCLECEEDYFLDTNENKCKQSQVTNCIKYQSIDSCEICKEGYGRILENNKFNCLPINTPNCVQVKLENNFPCEICIENYFPKEGICQQIENPIEKCKYYQSEELCRTCQKGTLLSLDKQRCLEETVYTKMIPSSCQEAEQSSIFCVECQPGHYFKNGECVTCSINGSETGCFTCDPFKQEECIVCKTGYYMNKELRCVKEQIDQEIVNPVDPVVQDTKGVIFWSLGFLISLIIQFKLL